jgi:uncharacterized protein YrrD
MRRDAARSRTGRARPRSPRLPGRDVGGDDCAEVRDVVYQGETGSLVGFTLNKRSWFGGQLPEVLPVGSIHAIGADAVMIEDPAAFVAPADAPKEIVDASLDRNVINSTVLTESGTSLGVVTDVIVAVGRHVRAVGYEVTDTGKASGRHATSRFVPLPEQIAVSGEALVVPDEVDRFIQDDLAGFGAAVSDYRAQLHEASDDDRGGQT